MTTAGHGCPRTRGLGSVHGLNIAHLPGRVLGYLEFKYKYNNVMKQIQRANIHPRTQTVILHAHK